MDCFGIGNLKGLFVRSVLVVTLFLLGMPHAAAEEAATQAGGSIRVKDEETQLAQRFALREAVESPFEYSVSVGDRRDDLRWSIANGVVNIASEVEWKDTRSTQLRAAARMNLGYGWLVRGNYSTGAVKSGRNRDSDYAGSDRTQEYSRSDSRSGGALRDASIGLGWKFKAVDLDSGGGLSLIPLVGLSIHQQSLTMYEGQQTIPATGALNGLNNSYNAQWKGSWAGLDARWEFGGNWTLKASFEQHRADYTAEADWNLRTDLAHPVSFKHVANGRGTVVSMGVEYRFSRNFLMGAQFDRQKWETWSGYDQTNFAYGGTAYYTLNPVSWNSTVTSLALIYQF